MAAAKGKAAPKKGAAARGEKKGKSKSVDFHGLTLTLPAKLPGTLLWDFKDVLEGNERSVGGFIGFLESLVGPEQSKAVRDKVREEDLGLEETFEALDSLLGDIFEASGLSQGE